MKKKFDCAKFQREARRKLGAKYPASRSSERNDPRPYKDYKWIVADPRSLGGSLAIRGTRLSVSLILECLSNGMTLKDIDDSFDHSLPHEALSEVLKVATEATSCVHVAAIEKAKLLDRMQALLSKSKPTEKDTTRLGREVKHNLAKRHANRQKS